MVLLAGLPVHRQGLVAGAAADHALLLRPQAGTARGRSDQRGCLTWSSLISAAISSTSGAAHSNPGGSGFE